MLKHRPYWAYFVCLVAVAPSAMASLVVQDLRCEYKVDPLGIDVAQPRFSWVLSSVQRNQKQSAYEILVASNEENLNQNKGDLWDSGKVAGSESAQIAYGGSELKTAEQCFWKVKVWDGDGNESEFSQPAHWEMGLLQPGDWKAQWIEANPTIAPRLDFQGAWWIWYPDGYPSISAPAGKRYFRRQVDLPRDRKIVKATMLLTVDDGFTFYVNGKPVFQSIGVPDDWKSRKEIDLTQDLQPGPNTIAVAAINLNTPAGQATPAGILGKLVVELEEAEPIVVATDKQWKTSAKAEAGWEKPGFEPKDWTDAMQVADLGQLPWGDSFGVDESNRPPCLRKQISLKSDVKRARLYATALGLYDFSINGQRVSDDVIKPDWDNYQIRVQYQTFDVTKLLQKGDNALAATLGPGWYCGHIGLDPGEFYGKRPALLGQLQIEYADGSTETVTTDKSWKWSYGPLIQSDLLDGEDYDARKEITGWDKAGFDDSKWNAVATRDSSAKLQAQIGPPIRKLDELPGKKVTEPKPGKLTFDLGQNMVGWIRLKVKGEPGTKLTLRYAEMLNPDGTVYTANLRNAKATDTYTLRSNAEETWEPHFTFHGFRYVEITGFPGKLGPEAVTGIVVHSDTPRTGNWECSDEKLNQLYRNIVWGQWGNFLSVPTDCPQRDERLGWMGDAQVFCRTATYNADVASFFTKWLLDVSDAQSPAGAYTDVSPRVCCGEGTAAWADAGVICPWTMYQAYDDKRLVERQYDSMVKYIDYLKAHSKDLIRPAEGYGDWLSIAADTPKDVLATGYFAYSTHLLAEMARAIGKEDDAKKYDQLFDDIKAAFNKAFVSEDAHIKGNTQTCYLIALKFHLLPEDKQAKAAQYLVDDIKARDMHVSTGFVGVSYMLPMLAKFGHVDVAYQLLEQDTFPSWLFSVKHGATTIWERWDGWTPEKGFQDPSMNSFNHYSLGSCGQWMYSAIAGIDCDPEHPGYSHILIHPRPTACLTMCKASYDSIRGPIATEWHLDGHTYKLKVTIPANTTALVFIDGARDKITEGDKPAGQAEGVKFERTEGQTQVFTVGSGTYDFSAPVPTTGA
jgi:alpha-L-rhamnosidase